MKVEFTGFGFQVILALDPDEAENIARALGYEDGAYQELMNAANECREMNIKAWS